MTNTLTRADLIERFYENTSKTRVECKDILENLLALMRNAVKKDHKLLLSGFGSFEAYHKQARRGRNPQTDEAMTLDERIVVVFRLSKKFRHELNG